MILRRIKIPLWRGTLNMLPLSLAVLPWGVLFGSLAVQRGFSGLEAMGFSLLVFGGAVQIVSVELMDGNASLLAVLFSAFVISSRHFLYGLALSERLSVLPARWRVPLGFLLTDELFAHSTGQRAYRGRYRLWYGFAAGFSFYLAWNLWTLIGVLAGSALPDLTTLGLDFAIAATFIALAAPGIKSLPALATVITAAICSVLFELLGFELALVASSLLAMSAGFAVNRWSAAR